MILQLSTIFSSLASGLGSVLQAAAPAALQTGEFFLQRELNRITARDQKKRFGNMAVQAGNAPGLAVTRIGGTNQPVGGKVNRPTFTSAALTPAQQPFGNIPLTPVQGPAVFNDVRSNPAISALLFPGDFSGGPARPLQLAAGGLPAVANGNRLPAVAGPRFATDEMGRAIQFVPSTRPGEGFITVPQARALGQNPTRPFWRFNRQTGGFEKIKRRRMNPFNFAATKRASRRIDKTFDAIKDVMRIANTVNKGAKCGGKVVTFKKKAKKKACR